MAKTASRMVPLGSPIAPFSLPDSRTGEPMSLADCKGPHGTLVMFICNHCPFVKHIDSALSLLAKDYLPRGIGIAAISANDVSEYPEDGPDKMKETANALGYTFPYLYDESQEVAKSYGAECTPDFFLYDSHGALVYRGQFDDSRPGNGLPVTGADLRRALDALLANTAVPTDQKPSIGCNIKWKAAG